MIEGEPSTDQLVTVSTDGKTTTIEDPSSVQVEYLKSCIANAIFLPKR